MKHIYKPLLLVVAALTTVGANAQNKSKDKEDDLNRQVMLEREYTPTAKEASRINQTPSIYEYQIKPRKAKFIEQSPAIVSLNKQLGTVGSGDIGTELPYSAKRGYFLFGGGTKANFDAAAGYRILDTQKDKLNLFGDFDATNGNVKYEDNSFPLNKVKAKKMDISINANYAHKFDPFTLNVEASFLHSDYNYYGNSFLPMIIIPEKLPFDLGTKQNMNAFTFGAGVESNKDAENIINYKANASYSFFKNKHGLRLEDEGMKGGIFKAFGDANTKISSEGFIGGRVYIMNQSFDNSPQHMKDTLKTFTNIGLNPYFQLAGLNWDAEIGLNTNMLFDKKTKFFISPNIKAQMHFDEVHTLYANLTGGVNDNTFLDIFRENRYVSPLGRVKYSKTQYDITLGFKTGFIQGFELDLFGGYKNTKDEHLYIASPMMIIPNNRWSNVSVPVYANVSTGHFGAEVKTSSIIPYTTLSAKAIGYFYSVKKQATSQLIADTYPTNKAWGKPQFTVDASAEVKPVDMLRVSIGYSLATGRKAYYRGNSVTMKAINEINARADVDVTDWFSINARVYNLLNQKYELTHGYTVQGLNFMGGFNFKF